MYNYYKQLKYNANLNNYRQLLSRIKVSAHVVKFLFAVDFRRIYTPN